MNQATAIAQQQPASDPQIAPPELSLNETLRVLEVARQIRQSRSEAQVALARTEIREMMRKRLLEAAAVTGDQVTEADIDSAIQQYFHRLYAYEDPPLNVSVFLAHLYVRRHQILLGLAAAAAVATTFFGWMLFS